MAAEDYTGASPPQEPGPHYLDYDLDALKANGGKADVYDVDARGRTARDHLGVLSDYDAITRPDGQTPGNADRLARRTRARSTSTRRSPTSPTSGSRGRSPCRPAAAS